MITSIVAGFTPVLGKKGVGSPIASKLGICSYAEWMKREHKHFSLFFCLQWMIVDKFCLAFQGDYFTLFWFDIL